MKVEADYKGKGKYYKGKITRDNRDGTYDVTYDDDDREFGKRADTIRSLEDDRRPHDDLVRAIANSLADMEEKEAVPPPAPPSGMDLLHEWALAAADLKYDPQQPISGGGQADVFSGEWLGPPNVLRRGTRVALKVARPASAAATHQLEEFMRREVRALSRVRHENVVPLLGVCLQPRPAVVMGFAEGGSLRDRLEFDVSGGGGTSSGPLTLVESVSLLADIARGMAAVHAHDIVHMDLKVRLPRTFFIIPTIV